MKAFLKRFFKKLWQILVRIFSFAPYVYSLEQVYEHEKEKVHELEHKLEKQEHDQAHETELSEDENANEPEHVLGEESAGKDTTNVGE